MTEPIKLPPLPRGYTDGSALAYGDVYDDEHMQAYARAAVEADRQTTQNQHAHDIPEGSGDPVWQTAMAHRLLTQAGVPISDSECFLSVWGRVVKLLGMHGLRLEGGLGEPLRFVADRQANNPEPLTPAEAVFVFAGWLTSRSDSVTLSSRHGAAIAAELAAAFNESQGLHRFREEFHKHIKPYPAEKDRQARSEPCLTCNDNGTVGNMLNAEPCPDCTPQPQQTPENKTPEAHLMAEAHKYWKYANTKHYGAVQWIENHETGELLIYTRGEYRKTLMKNIGDTQIPEGYKLVPQHLINLCEQITKWRNCMSYNDSYFGEPEGDLKRIAAEMERAMLEATPTKEKP